jgi:DNA-binding NarL/FixJ family response regulator
MTAARLLILAEERLIGRGMASLLEPRFETHSIESFQRLARLLGSEHEEIALWLGDRLDVRAVEQFDALVGGHPELRLCLLARSADVEALRRLLRRHPHGIAILFRTGGLDVGQVIGSLDQVLTGRATLEPTLLERLIDDDAVVTGELAELTPGEREVLELVAQGLRNGEIARRIWKSEKAVEKQVSHVFQKLGLDQGRSAHLHRRVAAARIHLANRPDSVTASRR